MTSPAPRAPRTRKAAVAQIEAPATTVSDIASRVLAALTVEPFSAPHIDECRAKLADLSDDEFVAMMRHARDVGADPLKGDIYHRRRGPSAGQAGGIVFMLRLGAMLTYAGRDGDFRTDSQTMCVVPDPRFVAKPNDPVSVIVTDPGKVDPDSNPEGIVYCAIGIYRHIKGEWHRITHTVFWRDYVPLHNGKIPEGSFWRMIPGVMIAKVALVGAMRKAFPALSTLYVEEEMGQSEAFEPVGRFVEKVLPLPDHPAEVGAMPGVSALQRPIKNDKAIMVDFLDGEGAVEVLASQYAQRVIGHLEMVKARPQAVVSWFEANLDARQEFWAFDQKLSSGEHSHQIKRYFENACNTLNISRNTARRGRIDERHVQH